ILVSDERKVIAELVYYVDKQRGFTSDFAYAKWNSNQKIQDHYELITNLNDHVGKSILMITRTSHIEHYAPYFESYELIETISIPSYNDFSIEYQAYLMHQFKGY
ncbi:MAG: hypothetical protein MK137_07880, partial [Rickettsiales bacterium]|nr:hypothetical protein [Rickettsiales bacterium]